MKGLFFILGLLLSINAVSQTEANIEAIRNTWGNLDILYTPESLENQKIMMGDIIRNASRYDLVVDVVNTAIELAMQIPGITPLEALIIAERDWINAGKISHA